MPTKFMNYEEAKPYLTKAEIDSYETMKTFATPQLLKTFEKELLKSANKRQREEYLLREKSIKLIQLFQELFSVESITDVESKMRELAEGKEEVVEEIVEDNAEDNEYVELDAEEEREETAEEDDDFEAFEDAEENEEEELEDIEEVEDHPMKPRFPWQ